MERGYVLYKMSYKEVRSFLLCLSSSFMKRKMMPTILSDSFLKFTGLAARQYSSEPIRPPLPIPNVYVKLNEPDTSTYPYAITREIEEMITHGDNSRKIKLQETLMLLYLKRERGDVLPEEISVKEISELLTLSEEDQHYCLNLIMKRREGKSARKWFESNVYHNERSEVEVKRNSCMPHTFLKYSADNTMFSSESLLKADRSRYYNSILSQGLLFGQKIVFDCAYDKYMSYAQLRQTAKELNDCIRINRRSRRPFGLYFCNIQNDDRLLQHLHRLNPSLSYDVPIHVHTGSYLDLFYSGDIVYLTPYVKRELEYRPDEVYVLGALTFSEGNLSVKRAIQDGVRCAKLPLGYYQLLNQTSVLGIKETFSTLLSKKNTGAWAHARKLGKHLTFH